MDIEQQHLRARKALAALTRAFAQADEYILPPRRIVTHDDWLEELQEVEERGWEGSDIPCSCRVHLGCGDHEETCARFEALCSCTHGESADEFSARPVILCQPCVELTDAMDGRR